MMNRKSDKNKSNLDERQEQALLQIEKKGCWFAFWGLLAALLIQQIVYGPEFRYIAGEWIVFMGLAVYLCIACLRAGIWDRKFQPNNKTNLIASAIAGVGFAIVMFISFAVRFPGKWGGATAGALISGSMVFILCMLSLTIAKKAYNKRKKELDAEPETDVDAELAAGLDEKEV